MVEITRSDFEAVLKKVSPALGSVDKSLVPVLSHLCFDGKYVTAYDGTVALRTQCKIDFVGALPGQTLLSVLQTSAVEKARLETTDSGVTVKMGRVTLNLAALPSEDFMFRKQSFDGAVRLELDDDLRGAIRTASLSASAVMADSNKSGITLVFGAKKITLYATDSTTLIRCRVPNKVPELEGRAFILHDRFYTLLLKMGARELLLTDAGDLVAIADGVELYGRIVQGAMPEQFSDLFASCNLDKLYTSDIPALLPRCLERAKVVDKEWVTLSYEPGQIKLYSAGMGTELRDSVKIDLGQESIEVMTRAECLLRYLGMSKQIAIHPSAVVIYGDRFVVLVAVKTDSEPTPQKQAESD